MLRWFIGIIIVWQLMVYALIAGGIFVDIYELFGIPWNSAGIVNVVGTLAGFLLLELPLIVLGAFLCYRACNRLTSGCS